MPQANVTPRTRARSQYPDTICVDLDGTLVRTDTRAEGLLRLLSEPGNWTRLPGWLVGGRAALKWQVAARGAIDPVLLPYEQMLIDYLRTEKKGGRRLVLATAADRHLAERVNAHLELFDEVIAFDGDSHLEGRAKGDALAERFGARLFTYAGHARPDLHVWRLAGSAVLVNTSTRLASQVAEVTPIERRINDRPSQMQSLWKALRLHQWLKNVLVFLPIVTANALWDTRAWAAAAVMFIAFCTTASAVYVVNDLVDLAADRRHPRKQRRPFASGDLPIAVGLSAAPLLLIVGLALSLAIGPVYVIAAYATCSLAYSIKLKELPLVDVFTLALLYTLRVFGGAEASQYRLSPWLLEFSIFLFLGLATVKRVSELIDLKRREEHMPPRRGYEIDDIGILQMMGVGASFVSVTVLALFVQSDSVATRYAHPDLLWLIVPLLLFWQCRLWLSTTRGYMHDDPIVYAAWDWVSWLTAAVALVVFLLARGLDSGSG